MKSHIFAVLLLSVTLCMAKTWYVSPFGSDVNSGTKANPLQSLRTALSLVDDGDQITLLVGLYSGSTNYGQTVSKKIKITGENKDRTILSCQGATSTGFFISGDVEIKDLNIQFCTNGIVFQKGTPIINNVNFLRNTNAITTASNVAVATANIQSCTFEKSYVALNIRNIASLLIKDNVFREGTSTNTLSRISSLKFERNLVHNNTYPVFIESSTSLLNDNVFEFNINQNTDTPSLKISGGAAEIKKCGFYGNQGNYGGAMYIYGGATISVTNTDFNDNIGKTCGGIYCSGGSGNIFDSTFKRNTANTAGSFYCTGNCQFFFSGTSMSENSPNWSNDKCKV